METLAVDVQRTVRAERTATSVAMLIAVILRDWTQSSVADGYGQALGGVSPRMPDQ